jgi:hypothetical protein
MVLDRLIGSRLEHADPKIRLAGLARLDAADPMLATLANTDPDAGVRRAALERTLDLPALMRAAREDADTQNRDVAAARWRALLAGPEDAPPGIDARVAALADGVDAAAAAFLVEHAPSVAVRTAALPHVTDEVVLARVAVADAAADLRRAALARVDDPALLEQIEHATRTHDQGVSRAARARLQSLRSARELQSEAEQLCARMAELAAGEGTAADEAAFHRLEQSWSAHDHSVLDPALVARYEAARAEFRERLAAHARARQARAPLHARRQETLDHLRTLVEMDDEAAAAAVRCLSETGTAWAAITPSDPVATERFEALKDAIRAELRRLERARDHARPLREVIEEARARLENEAPLTRKQLAAIEERAERAARPQEEALAHELEHTLGDLLERLRQRRRRENEAAEQAAAEIEAVVAQMEAALANGELAQALAHHDAAAQRLAATAAVVPQARALRKRMQAAEPQLAQLRDWQRWGVEQTRTALCQEAEALVGADMPLEELARKVRACRNRWKELDRTSGTTSKALWERFDRACTAAYAPCAAKFAEQAQERAQNLAAKEGVLAKLEALAATMDGESPDWRACEREFHACEVEWRKIGPVDRAIAKTLAERHRALRAGIEQRLAPRRDAEIARRKAVIAELTALAKSDDLRDAPARVKHAQAQWAPAVSARRSVEQALWTEFRAACDAVFARLRELRGAADGAQQAALRTAVSLCEGVEALARALEERGPDDDVAALIAQTQAKLAELRREQSRAPGLPPAEGRRMGARFREACARVERGLASCRDELAAREHDVCARRASLCRELEQQVLSAHDPGALAAAVERAQSEWDALPAVRGAAGAALERRFAAAREAARNADERAKLERSIAEQTEEKRQLCLRMEIVAGVPSPPACEAARTRYKAQWMQEAMRGTSRWPGTDREKLEEARRIEERWHALGALPVEEEGLEARYRRALDALRGSMRAAG